VGRYADDGPQCKTKNPDQYNVLKHPENFKLSREQNNAIKQLQQQINMCQQNPLACPPYDGPSVSDGSKYTTVGYQLRIDLRQMDWRHIFANAAGVVGDAATIAAFLDPWPVVDEVAVGGIAAGTNAIGVAVDAYDILAENDFSGSLTDTAFFVAQKTNAVKRIVPVFGLGVHISGLVEAMVPGIQQIPIIAPIPQPTIP